MVENVIQVKMGIKKSIDVAAKIQENIMCEKNYICNPSTCTYENGKYLESIVDDSVIMCDKIINAVQSGSRIYVNKLTIKKQPIK